MSEFEPEGVMPPRVYTKKELLSYLQYCRDKAYELIENMTEKIATQPWINKSKNFIVLEVLLYNMRHIQHHAAQFNKILREEIDDASPWVSVAHKELS